MQLVLRASACSHCPYCRSAFEHADVSWTCTRCRARHHAECAEEHGKCAVFACGVALARRRAFSLRGSLLAGLLGYIFFAFVVVAGLCAFAAWWFSGELLVPASRVEAIDQHVCTHIE